MKVELYNHLVRNGLTRRAMLKGAASAGALAAMGGTIPAFADGHSALRAAIMKIPGVGMGSPGDAEWQKVGELCLGPVKERVKPGEFKGVELTFMGLNNQNLHNFLFRGFLKPWEAYTGAKINWIDLAQADYNPRLQQSIATKTVDFDIIDYEHPIYDENAISGQLQLGNIQGYKDCWYCGAWTGNGFHLSLIHISEPTRLRRIAYAVLGL